MNHKIAIFFHCLFQLGDEIRPRALDIVNEQMDTLEDSGLLDVASDMIVGCNGGEESKVFCDSILPRGSTVVMHGLQCKNECKTIRLIEEWLPDHPGWHVVYFHSKGCSATTADPRRTNWRICMMKHVIKNWIKCITALDQGYDAAGCHYLTPPFTPPKQYILAGNFFWARSDYLRTLPSIMDSPRIKLSGIDAFESRYESEVWIGNGKKPPQVKDFHPGWRLTAGPHP